MPENTGETRPDEDATNPAEDDATNSGGVHCSKDAIGARIRAVAEELELGQAAMASKLGLALGSYKKYATGASAPGAEAIAAFIALGVNANWLLMGEGDRWITTTGAATTRRADAWSGEFMSVPLYDVRAAAGHGAWNSDEAPIGALAFRRDWIGREIAAPSDQLAVVYVDGDSMDPDLRTGDVVMLDRSVRELQQDGIYVLMLDDHMVIKRLQRLAGRKVRVSSSNPAYPPFEMDDVWDDADHWIVGRAVWAGRRL